jgi:hypothetical protein
MSMDVTTHIPHPRIQVDGDKIRQMGYVLQC